MGGVTTQVEVAPHAKMDEHLQADRRRRVHHLAQRHRTQHHRAIKERLVGVLEDQLDAYRQPIASRALKTTRIYNLLAHGPTFEQFQSHPDVLPVVERVLDPGLLISSLSSIAIGPGELAQPIHADDQMIPLARPHIPIICNTMWAITDFTEDNGATQSSRAATSETTPPIRSSPTRPSPPK